MGRRITSLESGSWQLGGGLQSVEKSNSEHSTRIRNLEDFKSEQAATNGKVKEAILANNVLNANLKQMAADLVQMKVDIKKSLGFTEDFFSLSETLQTQMSQAPRRMDQSLTVLLDRLRMECEALDQAIKPIEAGKDQS